MGAFCYITGYTPVHIATDIIFENENDGDGAMERLYKKVIFFLVQCNK